MAEFSAATWNVLADAYTHPSTYHYVADGVLEWERRAPRIRRELARLDSDVLMLQEVDRIGDAMGVASWLDGAGYDFEYMRRPAGKADGCVVAWRRSKFERLPMPGDGAGPLRVSLDDLAGMASLRKHSERYTKNNVAVCVALVPVAGGGGGGARPLLVASVHLYWNPAHADVKLRQTDLVVRRIEDAVRGDWAGRPRPAVLIGGDMNSKPGSPAVRYVLEGRHDAVPPHSLLYSRALVVTSLRRLAHMLRAVGCDIALLPAEEDDGDLDALFALARSEDRVLVTGSRKAVARRDCPPFVLTSSNLSAQEQFVDFVRATGLRLRPDLFYSRCLSCGAPFEALPRDEALAHPKLPAPLRASGGIDEDGETAYEFYVCRPCDSPYWWGRASHRSLLAYAELFRRAKGGDGGVPPLPGDWKASRGLVRLGGELLPGVDEAEVGDDPHDRSVHEPLAHGLELRSAADPPFTNLTSRFAATIDYLFYSPQLRCTGARPTMDEADARRETGLPSSAWPSDHVPVAASFELA